jgi:tetratricopeptide (TPR) repeat protein
MSDIDLAARLARGVQALGSGQHGAARADLQAVWDDAELAAATDLQDVRARVGSLLAQALLACGEPEMADRACRDTLRLLRRLGDKAGMDAVRALQDQAVRRLADHAQAQQNRAEAARVAETPLDDLLRGQETPEAQAAVFVRKATALLERGTPIPAIPIAERALSLARQHALVTWEVFARLVLARAMAERAPEHLRAALDAAAAAGEFNLVSTIARTAEEAGLAMPAELGPHTPEGER